MFFLKSVREGHVAFENVIGIMATVLCWFKFKRYHTLELLSFGLSTMLDCRSSCMNSEIGKEVQNVILILTKGTDSFLPVLSENKAKRKGNPSIISIALTLIVLVQVVI